MASRLSNAAGYDDMGDMRRSRFRVLASRFVFRFVFGVLVLPGVLATGCASKGGVVASPRPFPGASVPPRSTPAEPRPSTPAVVPPGLASAPDSAIIQPALISLALSLRGIPYRNGGSDLSGFDCSGFVQWVFAQQGMALPREVRQQYQVGEDVESADVVAGDLVFFETVSRGASHVGIALGDGTFVHAPSSNGVVRIERYTSGYWADRWVGARRVS
jgi:cell wall-associated NlpC family hydrolase